MANTVLGQFSGLFKTDQGSYGLDVVSSVTVGPTTVTVVAIGALALYGIYRYYRLKELKVTTWSRVQELMVTTAGFVVETACIVGASVLIMIYAPPENLRERSDRGKKD